MTELNSMSSVTSRTESCSSAFTKLIPSAGDNQIQKQKKKMSKAELLLSCFNASRGILQGEGHVVCLEIIVL